MPTVHIIEHNGAEHEVEAQNGESIMIAAVKHMIDGIDADCGGSCSCGTCHVFIDPQWMAAVGQADEYEEPMLDMNPERQETSRLSCQVVMSDALDGLIVRLPQSQF